MIEVAAIDLHVGQQEGLRLGVAFERDIQRLAHRTTGAVATCQVSGPHDLGTAVGAAQGGGDARRILPQADQLDAALDRNTELGQSRRQQRLGSRLRQQQGKWKGAVDALADGQGRQPALAFADAQRVQPLAFGNEAVDHSHALQRLQARAP